MDETDSTIKNAVFRQVMWDQIMIKSAENFCKAANQFSPSITKLFQKSDVIHSEPCDIEVAPVIPRTLKIHNLTRCPPTAAGETQIDFFFLTNSKEPCFTQTYAMKERCRHVDHDFDSLV